MPRGKSYTNNDKGGAVQSSSKKKAPSTEQCFYGKACTRKDCFYKHDKPGPVGKEGDKSNEPCMPFLAGQCTLAAGACRKRHPAKDEATRLVIKYKKTKCRFGKDCKTAGCLYIHPGDKEGDDLGGTAAFPPLSGSNGAPRATAPSGAWKPAQPTGSAVASSSSSAAPPASTTNQVSKQAPAAAAAAAPVKSAWQPAPPQAPAPVWGKGRNPVLANHSNPPPPPAASKNGNAATNGVAAPNSAATKVTLKPKPPPAAVKKPTMSFAAAAAPPPAAVVNSDAASDTALNINAKEFVPGGF